MTAEDVDSKKAQEDPKSQLLPVKLQLQLPLPGPGARSLSTSDWTMQMQAKQQRLSSKADDENHLVPAGARRGDLFGFAADCETFHAAYTLKHKIGEGGFGKVFLAHHSALGIPRAVKRLKRSKATSEMRKNELSALCMLSHPHIVKLIQYYDDEDFQYLVFELCQGPDLLDHIHNQPNRRMDEYAATVALRHMLKALQCCHASHRGHFDIKPENFMYSDVECTNLKMIDLGLSSGFHRKSKEVSALQGTAEYMAPEFWDGIYGPEGDVWSCGVVLFVMLTGENFLSDKIPLEKLPREIKVRKALACRLTEAARTYGYGHSTQDLLGSMLLHDRHARVTVRGCLRHALITGTYVTERENVSYSERPLIKKAHNIFRNIPSIFRAFAKEPMLKKVARLAFAHAGPTCLAEQYVFQMLDIHGYGEISIGVLEDDLERAGVPIPDDIEELFEAVDLNRDGYIGSLAFVSATLPASSLNDEALCRNVFSMFKKAKDGFLTASDLEDVFCHDEGSPICKDVLAEVCEEGEERLSLEQFTQMMGTEEFAVCGSAVAAVRKGLPWERSDGQKALKSELGA